MWVGQIFFCSWSKISIRCAVMYMWGHPTCAHLDLETPALRNSVEPQAHLFPEENKLNTQHSWWELLGNGFRPFPELLTPYVWTWWFKSCNLEVSKKPLTHWSRRVRNLPQDDSLEILFGENGVFSTPWDFSEKGKHLMTVLDDF